MIVIKFGGTSVADADRIAAAIDIVESARDAGPVVVVSALAGVTNQLVEAAARAADGRIEDVRAIVESIRLRHESVALELVRQKSDFLEAFLSQLTSHTTAILDILKGIALVGETTPRAKDKIVAIGEKLSSVLFAYSMLRKTLPGVHVDSEEVIVTDERFGSASPLMPETRVAACRVLVPEVRRRHIPVMGGFVGRSRTGVTTTLGRGGSDYSAAIVGAAIDADEIQIWTDVDGMMTCDPRLIPQATVIDRISYEEAAELAYFGAKVLHPKTIAPAVERGIPVRVLNTHNRSSAGTLITSNGDPESSGPCAIAVKKGITVLHLTASSMLGDWGFLARIFRVFEEQQVSVDLVTTSEVSVSVTIDDSNNLDALVAGLRVLGAVEVDSERAVIAVVGRSLLRDAGIGTAIFSALEGIEVSMASFGHAGLNLSLVIARDDADRAVRLLHKALFEGRPLELT